MWELGVGESSDPLFLWRGGLEHLTEEGGPAPDLRHRIRPEEDMIRSGNRHEFDRRTDGPQRITKLFAL